MSRLASLSLLLLAFSILGGTGAFSEDGAAAFTPGIVPSALTFWSSDPAGFKGEALASATGAEWVLGVEKGFEAGSGSRILFHSGKEEERTVARMVKGKREDLLYRSGSLASVSSYDSSGSLVEEKLYDPPLAGESSPRLRSSTVWTYVGGRLAKAEAFDGALRLTGSLAYSYDPAGRLQEVLSSGVFGSDSSGLLLGGSGLGASWSGTQLTRFDGMGRPRESLDYAEGKVVGRTVFAYSAKGLLVSRLSEDIPGHTATETGYDEGGRPVFEVLRKDGREVSRLSTSYDGQGRLSLERRDADGATIETAWTYGVDGDISLSSVRMNGVLVKAIHEREGGIRVTDHYDGGIIALSVTTRDGRLIREEFRDSLGLLRAKDYP